MGAEKKFLSLHNFQNTKWYLVIITNLSDCSRFHVNAIYIIEIYLKKFCNIIFSNKTINCNCTTRKNWSS